VQAYCASRLVQLNFLNVCQPVRGIAAMLGAGALLSAESLIITQPNRRFAEIVGQFFAPYLF